MTQKPYSNHPPPNQSELLAECHRLVNQISRRPGATKLLLGVWQMLQTFAQYKANRQPIAARPKSKPKTGKAK